jgi:hypothetical protein
MLEKTGLGKWPDRFYERLVSQLLCQQIPRFQLRLAVLCKFNAIRSQIFCRSLTEFCNKVNQ